MDIRDGLTESIGNTPLIRLQKASELTGCNILGKAEFLNPGGSVKDRAALFIIRDAEERGAIQAGGIVVEGTAGNTGIGLSIVGNSRGYRTLIVIPETQSQEKMDMLRLCGAELMPVPAVPYKNPENYVHVSERVAKELAQKEPNGALWANQWDNTANRDAHIQGTGPEIWKQTDGKVDGFTCAIGTGGTLAGCGIFLKEQNPDVRIVAADPMGAAVLRLKLHTGDEDPVVLCDTLFALVALFACCGAVCAVFVCAALAGPYDQQLGPYTSKVNADKKDTHVGSNGRVIDS